MNSLASHYRLSTVKHRKKIPENLDGVVYRVAGRIKSRSGVVARLLKDADLIQQQVEQYKTISDRNLKNKLREYQEVFKRKKTPDDGVLFSALAMIHEAAYRTLGMRPFPVQTAGTLALLNGYVAEMATGEGKTLTASLAATIRGWSRLPCHVVTANDYLAERDARKLDLFYSFCGISVGYVVSAMEPSLRKHEYATDITYTTAKEVTADFLRDRLALGPLKKFERRLIRNVVTAQPLTVKNVVMRGLHAAIIDEADSLLIDEAVIPLIISRKYDNEELNSACKLAFTVAEKLTAGTHYSVDYRNKDITLNEKLSINEVFTGIDLPKRFSGTGFKRELLQQALVAREFYHRDKQYVIQEEKVVIVDEFTGRSMPQRSWSDGLHQMVEVKEGVPITSPNETLARISFQRFFRNYHYLSGMTGTAREAMGELWQVYDLPVLKIPSNRPCQRIEYPPKIFRTQKDKWDAILKEIESFHREGRPILVGTRNVKLSEKLAENLKNISLKCKVINAIRHKEEAAIIALAGKTGAVTVATNMAGRGTDILLDKHSLKCGGLHVIATEFHESGRIDRQLYGRSGRQGDPGSNRTFAALDDELAVRFGNALMRRIAGALLFTTGKFGVWFSGLVFRHAQLKAHRRAARSRIAVQKMDLWLDNSLSFAREDTQS